MHKVELDRMLEKTVADALGVRMPVQRRAQAAKPKQATKAPRRQKQHSQEMHPA